MFQTKANSELDPALFNLVSFLIFNSLRQL